MCGESQKYELRANKPSAATQQIKVQRLVISQYADYLDTGIWDMKDGEIIAPDDLTISQLKDFLRVSGGVVYLRTDGKLWWTMPR